MFFLFRSSLLLSLSFRIGQQKILCLFWIELCQSHLKLRWIVLYPLRCL
jgi:hypothetical protein